MLGEGKFDRSTRCKKKDTFDAKCTIAQVCPGDSLSLFAKMWHRPLTPRRGLKSESVQGTAKHVCTKESKHGSLLHTMFNYFWTLLVSIAKEKGPSHSHPKRARYSCLDRARVRKTFFHKFEIVDHLGTLVFQVRHNSLTQKWIRPGYNYKLTFSSNSLW